MAEFKTAVKRLHEAGIEVILDVVYNHTGEGNHLGPTLSFRGIDNLSYYRLDNDRRHYLDVTGTATRSIPIIRASCRWSWTRCATGRSRCMSTGSASIWPQPSARENGEYSQGSAFFDAIRQDPALARAEADRRAVGCRPRRLSARQFSAGLGGMERAVPRFGAPLLEGRPGAGRRNGLAQSPAPPTSSAIAAGGPGRASTSSPPMTASRCRTWSATKQKHNEANGEDNRDGHDAQFQLELRRRRRERRSRHPRTARPQKRNLLATLLLSLGVPMLLAGDEFGRSQEGNSNAYCQDNEISWLDWQKIRPEDEALRRVRAHPDPSAPAAPGVLAAALFSRRSGLARPGSRTSPG